MPIIRCPKGNAAEMVAEVNVICTHNVFNNNGDDDDDSNNPNYYYYYYSYCC